MTKPFAGYIRVSSASAARQASASFISPDVQADTVRRLAAAKQVELLPEIVQELNVSGGRDVADRALADLVERVRSGELGGVIVWKLSRFSRSLADGVVTASEIVQAGGRILADDFDSDAPMSKAMLGLMLGLAEEERDARREGWLVAKGSAIARGVWPSVVPLGYDRDEETGALVPNGQADLVRACFVKRAGGGSLGDVARMLGKGREHARSLLGQRVYRGEIVHAQGTNLAAHPAIVDEDTWRRAQVRGTNSAKGSGVIAETGILLGTVTCGGCGRPMTMVSTGKGEKREASYTCRKHRAAGVCPSPASATVRLLDALVVDGLDSRSRAGAIDLDELDARVADAHEAMTAADARLAQTLAPATQDDLGDSWGATVRERREDVAAARDAWMAAKADADEVQAAGRDAGIRGRRLQARHLLDRVSVSKSTNGRWSNLADRVTIEWADAQVAA